MFFVCLCLFVAFIVCHFVASLVDMHKVKMAWVTTVSSEIKPLGTRLTCYLNCDGSVC